MSPRSSRLTRALTATLLVTAAIVGTATVPAAGATANVAVWNDPAYAHSDEEGANTIAALEDTGATVTSFTGVTAAAFTTALATADVLVIPELEVGNPVGALEAGAEAAIVDFVEAGGTLLVFEPAFGDSLTLTNDLFGLTVAGGSDGACPCSLAATAAGTAFAAGPATLPSISANGSVTAGSLPVGSTVIYESDADPADAAIAVVPVVAGQIIFLGPDAFDTLVGTSWINALDLALGAARPVLSIDSVEVPEGDTAVLTASLSAAAASDVNVLFSTANGTATGPDDFTPLASTVVIPAGETSVAIQIDTVDDSDVDPGEAFTVTIESSSAQVVLGEVVGTVTIVDDEAPAPGGPAVPVAGNPGFTG
ncbi:MAG: Calx-beta domain-containing protein [Acidimicrobiales bacterium]